MPYFALMYDMVDDFVARRAAFRDEHLRLARESYARGELVLAGALADSPRAHSSSLTPPTRLPPKICGVRIPT